MMTHKAFPGQSLIEFALIFPLLFFLVMGLFDIGRAILYYSVLNTAAREGTRFAIVQPYCDYLTNPASCSGGSIDAYPLNCDYAASTANINICNATRNKLFNIIELTGSTITINHVVSSTDDPIIIIDIDFDFSPITPGLSLISDFTLRVNSQMLASPLAVP